VLGYSPRPRFWPSSLTAAHSGAFIVDPLNHWLGRRGEIFLTGLCLTATPIGSAFARTWEELFIARFIMGIGIGAKNATVPIYSAEMAPARIRGALVMFWQLWVVAGELLHIQQHNSDVC
jgi:MFS family permease